MNQQGIFLVKGKAKEYNAGKSKKGKGRNEKDINCRR